MSIATEQISKITRADGVGPRGGNLNRLPHETERRNTGFQPRQTAEGVLGLHAFEDKAVMGLKDEKPWHRMAAYMMLSGTPLHKIAQSAGVTESDLRILKAQRWYQELLAELAQETGSDIMNVVKSEALSSVSVLVNLRDNSESERIKLTAAISILEHAHGKPTQRIISEVKTRSAKSPQEEYEDIQRELAELRQVQLN